MSDYTPTTAVVRGAYHAWSDGQPDDFPVKPTWSRREFDRWLAAHDAEVRREGHREGFRTALDDLASGAFIGGSILDAFQAALTKPDSPMMSESWHLLPRAYAADGDQS